MAGRLIVLTVWQQTPFCSTFFSSVKDGTQFPQNLRLLRYEMISSSCNSQIGGVPGRRTNMIEATWKHVKFFLNHNQQTPHLSPGRVRSLHFAEPRAMTPSPCSCMWSASRHTHLPAHMPTPPPLSQAAVYSTPIMLQQVPRLYR